MWKSFVREYLRFSRRERHGILILVVFMILTGYSPDLLFYCQRRMPVADSSDLKAAVMAYEAGLRDGSTTASGQPLAGALFYFDPNALSVEGWQQLGVSERTAVTIGKYLAHGGHFRHATDLAKIYSLPPALCVRLVPYVRIADRREERNFGRYEAAGGDRHYGPYHKDSAGRQQYAARAGKSYYGDSAADNTGTYRGGKGYYGAVDNAGSYRAGKAHYGTADNAGNYRAGGNSYHDHAFRNPDSSFTRYHKKALPTVIDINTADTLAWQTLPGIGPGFARRIVSFRDRLGGFYAVKQVGECYGLADSIFQKIQPFLQIGNSSLTKLDLNLTDEKSLAAHPYIRYKLARLIVQYRSTHAGFKAVSELRSLPLVDEIIYRKIEYYIEIKH
jgi:DNA uptake protein ComE-like DNA-binding protein